MLAYDKTNLPPILPQEWKNVLEEALMSRVDEGEEEEEEETICGKEDVQQGAIWFPAELAEVLH